MKYVRDCSLASIIEVNVKCLIVPCGDDRTSEGRRAAFLVRRLGILVTSCKIHKSLLK